LFGNPLGVSPDELRDQAERLGILERFHLPGRVERPAEVLPVFDVFVNCSVFEGMSNAILEAMAARIPVVATAVGGTPEAITHGVEGLLVPPEDPPALAAALLEYLDDPEKRVTAGEAGRKRIEAEHTLDVMLDAYLDFYRRAGAAAKDVRGRTIVRSVSAAVESVRRVMA
jgi:glycosyltransferase involved in cell wall biosynthesis